MGKILQICALLLLVILTIQVMSANTLRRQTRRPITLSTTRHAIRRHTTQPTIRPKTHHTFRPITRPTTCPKTRPTQRPTARPKTQPTTPRTTHPKTRPTTHPTTRPTTRPTSRPTTHPTTRPTTHPKTRHTTHPTTRPTTRPTIHSKTSRTTSHTTKATTSTKKRTTGPSKPTSTRFAPYATYKYYLNSLHDCGSTNYVYANDVIEIDAFQNELQRIPLKSCKLTFILQLSGYHLNVEYSKYKRNYIDGPGIDLHVYGGGNRNVIFSRDWASSSSFTGQEYQRIEVDLANKQGHVNYDLSLRIDSRENTDISISINVWWLGVVIPLFIIGLVASAIGVCIRRRRRIRFQRMI